MQDDEGRVIIDIDIRESKKDLSLVIENTLGNQNANKGNGMAINNIKERLFVLYDDQYTFKARNEDNSYRLLIRFPKKSNLSAGTKK